MLTLFLGRTGPAIDDDKRGDFHTGFLECLAVFLLTLFGEQRMLVEGVDTRVRGLLDVFVSPVCDFVHILANGHLLGEYVNVKGDFHIESAPFLVRLNLLWLLMLALLYDTCL